MVTIKLIFIMAVALAGLAAYVSIFIFQQWWVIYLALVLTLLMLVITVILTGGRVEDDQPSG